MPTYKNGLARVGNRNFTEEDSAENISRDPSIHMRQCIRLISCILIIKSCWLSAFEIRLTNLSPFGVRNRKASRNSKAS